MSEQQKKAECLDCGLKYSDFGIDLVLPDQQWSIICPEGTLLCGTCICRRISKNKGSTVLLAWIDRLNYQK